MSMYDSVELSSGLQELLGEGAPLRGWQTKSLDCINQTVTLGLDTVITGTEERPHFSGEIRFYACDNACRWFEYIATYKEATLFRLMELSPAKAAAFPTKERPLGWIGKVAETVARDELIDAWEEMEHAVNAVVTALPSQLSDASATLETTRQRMRGAVKSFTFWRKPDGDDEG